MKSYGKVAIGDNGRLYMKLLPHAAMMARRLFDGSQRAADNSVVVSASDINCHTLEWFMQRYPLDLVGAAMTAVPQRAARRRRQIAIIEEAKVDGYEPPEFALAEPARDYQRTAADAVLRAKGLVLADDLGLGKTVSAICAMTADGALPCIVVAKRNLLRQWHRMINRFAPALRVHVVRSMQPYELSDEIRIEVGTSGRRRIVRNGQKRLPDVILLNYDKLRLWGDHLAGINPGLIVYDECQELRKGEKSKKGEAAKAVSDASRFRLGLSATPIHNYGGEVWNVYNAIAPDMLGTREEFHREWCRGNIDKAQVIEPETLHEYLVDAGVLLRRTRKQVGRELPPMQRLWVDVDTDEKQLAAASDAVAELARTVLRGHGDPLLRMKAAGELDWRMRQATGLAKVVGVLDFMEMALDSEERIVLTAHHHLVFDALFSGLERRGIRAVRFTGRESEAAKQRSFEDFTSPHGGARVFLLANSAGAGFDGLQFSCRTIVHGELDWSPAVHLQNEGRLDRDGQPESVTSYFLIASEGSDPVIRDVLGIKEVQRAGIVEGQSETGSELATVDLHRIAKLAEACLRRRGG